MTDGSPDSRPALRTLGGDNDTITRRRFLEGAAATGAAAATAGCTNTGNSQDPSTANTPATTQRTTKASSTTEEQTPTTTAQPVTVEQLQQKRANLTEDAKLAHYQQNAIPNNSNYELDIDRVLRENDSLEGQIFDIYQTVGNQTTTRTQGNHKIVHALNQHPEIGWEQRNLTNIVTRYNDSPIEQIIVNYQEDGNRQADGMIDGQTPGDHYTTQNIPDSEVMDGDMVNFLTTDTEGIEENREYGDGYGPEDWEMLQLTMQTIVPGVIGPSVNANRHNGREATDHHILFKEDALSYISESYKDSAEAMLDVTVNGVGIAAATEGVRNTGKYVELGADQDGLTIDKLYNESKGKEVMKQPVNL